MKKFIFAVLAAAWLLSCSHSGKDGARWAGTYEGVTPGANSAIKVEITLNKDGTYRALTQYIDKGGDIFSLEGKFSWIDDENIVLDGEEIPPYYKVGENTLLQLDMSGKKIEGEFAADYLLKKR